MHTITLDGRYLNDLGSMYKRRIFLRDLFEMADEFGWTIRVTGQHW